MAELIGLDITHGQAHALVGEVKWKKVNIIESYELVPPVVKDGEVQNVDDILKDLIEKRLEKNGRHVKVHASIYTKSLLHKFEKRKETEQEFEKSMKQQIYRSFSMDHDKSSASKNTTVLSEKEYIADYAAYGIIEDLEEGNKLAVSYTAIKRHLSAAWIKVFQKNKFQLLSVDAPYNAIYLGCQYHRTYPKGFQVIVHMAAKETVLLFCEQQMPVYFRSIFMGLNEYRESSLAYCQEILSNIVKISKERKYEVNTILLSGNSSEWFGVQSLLSQPITSNTSIEAIHWEFGEDETISTHGLTIYNDSGEPISSAYCGAYGMLIKGVLSR